MMRMNNIQSVIDGNYSPLTVNPLPGFMLMTKTFRSVFSANSQNKTREMFIQNRAGECVCLVEKELTLIWFHFTGVSGRTMSQWLNTPEGNISYLKRKIMRKLKINNISEFRSWFLEARVCDGHDKNVSVSSFSPYQKSASHSPSLRTD